MTIATIEDLNNLKLDVDSFEQFTNGDENTIVKTRKDAEYPSIQRALQDVYKKGMLGAKSYKTLKQFKNKGVNGEYAVVTLDDDLSNNGYYTKVKGKVVELKLNPQKVAIEKAEEVKELIPTDPYYQDENILFAFTDKDGGVGVTIDNNGFINSANIYHEESEGKIFSFVDADNKELLYIDKIGNLRNNQLNQISDSIGFNFDLIKKSTSSLKQTISEVNEKIQKVEDLLVEDKDDSFYYSDMNHVFSYGQSLSEGHQATPPVSKSPKDFMFKSGVRGWIPSNLDRNSFVSLQEKSNETPTTSIILGLDSSEKFIGTANGRGGTKITYLSKDAPAIKTFTSTQEELNIYQGFMQCVTKAKQIAQSQNKSYTVSAIAWIHGESGHYADKPVNGVSPYIERLTKLKNDLISDIQNITKQTFKPIFVTYQTGAHLFYATKHPEAYEPFIAYAQNQVVDIEKDVWMSTPIYFLKHASDNLHLTNVASFTLGAYMSKAINSIIDNGDFQPLKPVSILNQGKVIQINFNKNNLTFDTSTIDGQPNKGFDIYVNNVLQTNAIQSVTVKKNRVVLKLDNAYSNASVAYARGRAGQIIAKGNLRDSDGDLHKVTFENKEIKLHNWCIGFTERI